MSEEGEGPPGPGPAWLEGSALFARFWVRLGVSVGVLGGLVVLAGLIGGWGRLHQWTSGLMLAGLCAWAVSLLLLLALSVVSGVRRSGGADAPPPAAFLLSYALVLAFAALAPMGLGIALAALFT